MVGNNVGVVNRSEYSDFIDGVFLFLIREVDHSYFFEGIGVTIRDSAYFID